MNQDWAEETASRQLRKWSDYILPHGEIEAAVEMGLAKLLREAEQRGFRRGVESAAKILQEHANGYADLRTMALEQKDIKSAFANLCESQACLITVKDVRALLSEKTEGER